MELKYLDSISVNDYNRLREEVGWGTLPDTQASFGLKNSFYVIACECEGKVIATARVISDGGYVAYIADVMVSPEYQRKGIGRTMLENLMKYLHGQLQDGWKMMIVLMAVQGKEPFYEQFGFQRCPSEYMGAGMFQWIE